jgi:hypothetical protein
LFFYVRLGSVKLNVDFTVWKINGKIPDKLGNTPISIKIRGVFPLALHMYPQAKKKI